MSQRGESIFRRPGLQALPWTPAALTLGAFALLSLLAHDWVETGNLRWLDNALRWRENLNLAEPLADEIRIIEVDRQDLAAIGDDGEYAAAAETIRRLATLGASVIVVDVLYSRGAVEQQQLIRNAVDEARASHGARIVLPAVLFPESAPQTIQKSLPAAGGDELDYGIINMGIDRDRLWRRYPPVHRLGNSLHPSLALAAHLAGLPESVEVRRNPETGTVEWTELSDDLTTRVARQVETKPRLLNLPHTYFSDAVDQRHERGRRIWNLRDFEEVQAKTADLKGNPFQGAVVFFGYSAGVDEKATAMGPQEPGVFLHATAFNDLLQDCALRRASFWQDLLLMALVAAVAVGLFQIDRKRWLFTWGLVGLGVIVASGFALVCFANFVPGTLTASALWLSLIFVEIGRRHSVELVQRIRTDTTLAYYFSDSVLKSVRENPGSTDPREAELSVLITDIRNFTTLCEKLPPKEMFRLLSGAFGVQTSTALEHDGSLQHFWGDQFLAYWGAPEPQADAADRALMAARSLCARLLEFQKNLPDDIAELFGFGVALHHGNGLVGNMGSGRYLDYCVFGDVVNVSARIEALTKRYGVRMLATRTFCDALQHPPAMRLLDEVFVVGKRDNTVELFELQPDAGSAPYAARFAELAEAYAGAMVPYRRGDFTAAAAAFTELAEKFGDPVSRVMAQRSMDLQAAPPAVWEGVYRFDKK